MRHRRGIRVAELALATIAPGRTRAIGVLVRVGVPRETSEGERRVAATPETITRLLAMGLEAEVEHGAGTAAGHDDLAYTQAGASIVDALDPATLDVLLHVRPLTPDAAKRLRAGTVTVGLASPASELPTVSALASAGVTSFALELVPRISRAQSMDALTSQALVAGYRCVLEAATRYPRFFPLYMTAAGTIPPAKVLVLGAGVAGLQAIGTAKRLGGRVSAYDVRPASADEVASMGGTFVSLDLNADEGTGGYAREQSEDRSTRQRQLLAPYVAAADVLITTAAIPGRPAPLLVTAEMVAAMRPGSVVVDLAAESGGNVEGSIPGTDVTVASTASGGSVTIVGMKDAASAMPSDASRLYAANVTNFLETIIRDGALALDWSDEVVAGACLAYDGEVRHAPTRDALGLAEAPEALPEAPPEAPPAQPAPNGDTQ